MWYLRFLFQCFPSAGFTNIITADNGYAYQLPSSEFIIEGNYTLNQVFEMAERAVLGSRRESAILVISSRGITFKLREAKT